MAKKATAPPSVVSDKPAVPAAPSYLCEEAKMVWDMVAIELFQQGSAPTRGDMLNFGFYCDNMAAAMKLSAKIKDRETLEGTRLYVNPQLKAMNQRLATANQLAVLLGIGRYNRNKLRRHAADAEIKTGMADRKAGQSGVGNPFGTVGDDSDDEE